MKGRKTIATRKAFTPDELLKFMEENWDRENVSEFGVTRKSNGDLEYIVLPATENWDVILYPKAAGGLFNKEDKIVLSAARATHGIDPNKVDYTKYFRKHHDSFMGIKESKEAYDLNKEMQGPCEEALLEYTDLLTKLLKTAGFLK